MRTTDFHRGAALRAALAAVLLAGAQAAHAEKADRDKPTSIEANSMSSDDTKRVSIFQGNVLLTKGTIAVRADRAYLLESLMEPNARLAKGFENLKISPMPPLGTLLKEQELEDILAFLGTLTKPPKDGITVPAHSTENFE